MAIGVTCKGCGKSYNVDEKNAGKKGRCKQCGTTFVVPTPGVQDNLFVDDPADPLSVSEPEPGYSAPPPAHILQGTVRPPPFAYKPAAYSPPPPSAPPPRSNIGSANLGSPWSAPRPKSRSASNGAAIGGGGLGLIIVIRLIVYGTRLFSSSSNTTARAPDPPSFPTTPPHVNMAPAWNPPPITIPHIEVPHIEMPAPYVPPPMVMPPPQAFNPIIHVPRLVRPGNDSGQPRQIIPPRRVIHSTGSPTEHAWAALPDAPATRPSMKSEMRFVFPLRATDLLYPAQASAFVGVGDDFDASSVNADRDVHEVWSLKTGLRTGRITGATNLKNPLLSPDGQYIAGRITGGQGQATTYDIWSFRTGKRVQTLAAGVTSQNGLPVPVSFVGTDQLATMADELQLWDIKSGALVRRISSNIHRGPDDLVAASAGGRLIAVLDADDKLSVVDVVAGKALGDTALPLDENNETYSGREERSLAFSPDGKELALFLPTSSPRIIVWTVADGKIAANFKLSPNNNGGFSMNRRKSPMSWLPDSDGWLVRGSDIVDRATGLVVYEVPDHREESAEEYGPRRVIDSGHVLMSFKSFTRGIAMETVSLPADVIARSRAAVRQGTPTTRPD